MSDPPYILDFLQQVVGVHWGGSGPFLLAFAQSDPGAGNTGALMGDLLVNFADQSGGTPGFYIIQSGTPIVAGPAAKTVTAKDLTGPMRAGAGHMFKGFALGWKGTDNSTGQIHAIGAVVIDLAGLQSPVHLNVNARAECVGPFDSNTVSYGVFLYDKEHLKVGSKVNINFFSSPPFFPPGSSDDNGGAISASNPGHSPETRTDRYLLDTKKLTITQL